jgi:DNA-binding transcriptional MerR regulator
MNPDLKLNPEEQKIYDRVPADKPRSLLEPHRRLILRWRRQGRTYRRIQQILADECQVNVSHQAIRYFVERNARPREQEPELEEQTALLQQTVAEATPNTPQPPAERKRMTPEEKAARVEFLRALRKKPVIVPEVLKPRFEYDPDKPLIIDRNIKD